MYINKKPKDDRHHIITGVGISIYLPNAPEVLIKSVARVNPNKWVKFWFFILGWTKEKIQVRMTAL